MLASLPNKGPTGPSDVLNFMYKLYCVFIALTLRKTLSKCFSSRLTFISKTTEVKGAISSGPDLKAQETSFMRLRNGLIIKLKVDLISNRSANRVRSK